MPRKRETGRNPNTRVQAPPSDMGVSPPLLDAAAAAAGKPVALPETQPRQGFPIVGIGASAGGLAAFEAFFSAVPTDTDPGMAFVLIQHLAPDHRSILCDLIRRYTRMPVSQVEDGVVVQPNSIYIIPPGRDMACMNGALRLLEPSADRGHRMPIDFFFRSLAEDQHERAIGIVLSGSGSDGSLGVRAIKGGGGMVMAQNTASTEFDGMPRSAVATGLVDFKLLPAEMPAKLIAYAVHASAQPLRITTVPAPGTEHAMKRIFTLLRAQTGHDFSEYKPSTIRRRVERRMAVHEIDAIEAYVTYLQQMPAEVEALFHDLLIGVTRFFRDRQPYDALEAQVIPKLFEGKPAGATIRVWTPGCSTGEEAYSIAILLVERMEALRTSYAVQVFATDIDSRAIVTARAGLYPASIATDVSPERLARFFMAEAGDGYRVRKSVRDLMVFAEQDLVKDPPFSRLDLLSCRNVLIYMGSELQTRLIPLFHYALKPDGWLFLGTSEGVGRFDGRFAMLDRKSKLYRRTGDVHEVRRAALGRLDPPMTTTAAEFFPHRAAKAASIRARSLREVTEQALLQEVVAAGVLVTGQGDILYLHGRSGMFLEPAQGEPAIRNILKMAREGLRHILTKTLQEAVSANCTVHGPGLRVKTNGGFTTVNLTISPVTTDEEAPRYLVVLEEALPFAIGSATPDAVAAGAEADGPATPDADARIAALKKELRTKDAYIESTIEQLRISTEDLKSSNEEMQSINEEFQSTNEELETSKEELQSVNEELDTVNNELQSKVASLSRTNDDMNNLLAGTGIATVFVDHQLRILRFTPAAAAVINLIPNDEGRPLAHIVSNLVGYDTLVADTQAVLETLVPKETEMATLSGDLYLMRIQPYRTQDNEIEGAVICFLNITAMVGAREALRKVNELARLAVVVRDANDAITMQDLEGRILAWNPAAVRMYGWSEAEALLMNARDRIPRGLQAEASATIAQLSLGKSAPLLSTQRFTKKGAVVEVSVVSTALVNAAGRMYAIATTEREVDG